MNLTPQTVFRPEEYEEKSPNMSMRKSLTIKKL
jgi:hypothetical protein